jgi:hypothetical protein
MAIPHSLIFLSLLPGLLQGNLGLFKQLNSELGVLCQNPPSQALNVCRIHAKLVSR